MTELPEILTADNTFAIGKPVRVFVGDEDVSDRCAYFDTKENVAACYVKDADGNFVLRGDELALVKHEGRFEWVNP